MKDENNQIWYSGDWRSVNQKQAPYNGIKIETSANYGLPTNDSSPQKLISVDVVVTDYTYDPKGVSSKVTLTEQQIWYDIPFPENNSITPPKPNTDFSVCNCNSDDLPGQLKLESNLPDIFLQIGFRYGLPHNKREEIGYILRFNEFYKEE